MLPGVGDTTDKKRQTSPGVNGNIMLTGKIGQFLAKCLCPRPLVDIISDQWQSEKVITMSASWWRFLSFLLGKSSEKQSTSLLLYARDKRGKVVICGF